MPVMGSSFDFRVDTVQDGEMRRSVARVGVLLWAVLEVETLMRTLMSGAVCKDMVLN